jgi:hypothetical protein
VIYAFFGLGLKLLIIRQKERIPRDECPGAEKNLVYEFGVCKVGQFYYICTNKTACLITPAL